MARSQASFDEFVRANVSGLLRTAFLITLDEEEAKDLVQECLFKVARRWPRVSSMQQPMAYARKVLINLGIDDAKPRARRRTELQEPAVEIASEPSELARLDSRAELATVLRVLPPRQRAAVVLRYFLDLSEAETARVLGCSQGTVKSTTSKALARLRMTLDPNRRLPEVSEP